MDIIRGNLDGISRPASNSRIHPESRSSSASLEVLTPEPVSIKVDTSINLNGSSQQSNRENYNLRESSSIDDVFKIKESDLQLQEAVKKMKRLDKLLVEKQFKEKEIKKQGQEMRTKLWEELRTIKNVDAVQSHEEIENTKKFVTLVPSSEETTDSFHLEQEEPFISVFHTQIPPEEYENCIEQARQESVYQSESNKSLVKPEKKPQRDNFGELKGKKNQDFIKRNIELAKDSKSVVFMMDKEKRRLIELLKDIDDGEDILPSTEEIVLHDNTQVKVTPGDKALRNTKEHREEKNRLKEIDQQLRELEEDFMN